MKRVTGFLGVVAGLLSIPVSHLFSANRSNDVTLPPKGKVTICHKPGTPDEETMMVPPQAVPGHLGHGDRTGDCNPPKAR